MQEYLEEKQIITVSELNRKIKNLLEPEFFRVYVQGEVSGFKTAYSGHSYFTVKDKTSCISCVCFKSNFSRIKFEIQDGMEVIVKGSVSVYEPRGSYQIVVTSMEPVGKGSLQIAFEQLKKKLFKEGLFDESNKKKLPEFPEVIGVATSATGAAIRDIINVLSRRCPLVKLKLYPVLVQGEKAKFEIVDAIEYFNRERSVDVLIIGRGGGSIEDLWAFNEEMVARAIFKSEIPVISAVGHEIDYSISDFTADLRAPTPSAAAELVVPDMGDMLNKLSSFSGRINFNIKNIINTKKEIVQAFKRHRAFIYPAEKINMLFQQMDNYREIIIKGIKRKLEKLEIDIKNRKDILNNLNPLNILNRGYSISYKLPEHTIIKGTEEVEIESKIKVKLAKGFLECIIEKKG